jgi:hypothetical protein
MYQAWSNVAASGQFFWRKRTISIRGVTLAISRALVICVSSGWTQAVVAVERFPSPPRSDPGSNTRTMSPSDYGFRGQPRNPNRDNISPGAERPGPNACPAQSGDAANAAGCAPAPATKPAPDVADSPAGRRATTCVGAHDRPCL